jgi:hypothetical protein
MFAARVASGQLDEPGVKLYDARDTEGAQRLSRRTFRRVQGHVAARFDTLTPRLVSHEFFNDQQIGFALWCFLPDFGSVPRSQINCHNINRL